MVREANREMLFYVYGAVIALCFITFRSWRAVVVAVVPLVVTSILAEALMVVLGIGVKVGTLPVIALGVGIGNGVHGIDHEVQQDLVQVARHGRDQWQVRIELRDHLTHVLPFVTRDSDRALVLGGGVRGQIPDRDQQNGETPQ